MEKLKCEIIVNKTGNEYVGLNISKNKITIYLPIGYHCEEIEKIFEITQLNENIKSDIRNLMLILARKSKLGTEKDDNIVDINLLSAIRIIDDYNKYGLYKQTELKRRDNYKGRINWQRTIQKNKISVNGKIIYTNTVNEYIDYRSEKEIQKIQEICLYEISEKIGFLLNFKYPKTINEYKKIEMIKILNDELKTTNEDIKNKVLNNLLDFVSNTVFSTKNDSDISIKYKEFEYIYQSFVDYYGIKNKYLFYPESEYRFWKDDKFYFKPMPSLPDTIIIDNDELPQFKNDVFILDAKYKGSLPNEYDIFKQIRYKKYLQNVLNRENIKYKNIENVFILPNDLQETNDNVKIEKYYATCKDYIDTERIFVVYVDTKSLIFDTKNIMKEVLTKIKNFKKN